MKQLEKKFLDATDLNTLKEQINSVLQELYTRLDSPAIFTRDGGWAVPYKNVQGAQLNKGELVDLASSADSSVELTIPDAINCIGVVYENIPVGEVGLVVTSGKAYVLLKDGTGCTAGNWFIPSDVAGRADGTATLPNGGTLQAHDQHFGEIGHGEETKIAGTNVLALVSLHFN